MDENRFFKFAVVVSVTIMILYVIVLAIDVIANIIH